MANTEREPGDIEQPTTGGETTGDPAAKPDTDEREKPASED